MSTIYVWQYWSDLVSLEGMPDHFNGTIEEAEAFFVSLHSEFLAKGYTVENYGDEIHLYGPDVDWGDDVEPVAGMTIEGAPLN